MSQMNELTLLYVEDDDALREQFLRILKPRFKTVYEAIDGAKALELYAQHSPTMLLVDINLPKIDGLEVIERIRANDSDIPIIILSAYSDQKKLLRAVVLGLSDYLIKPIPQKKLLLALEDMAQKYNSQKENINFITIKNGYGWKKKEQILSYHEEVIPLTKREMMLLDLMISQINEVLTLFTIEDLLWHNKDDIDVSSSLSHLLKRLRKKLPEELIENIYGEGYRINS